MAVLDFQMPQIDITNLNNTGYAKRVSDQLSLMDENLRYMFSHLDQSNFSDSFNKILNSVVSDSKGNASTIKQISDEILLKVQAETERATGAEGEISSQIQLMSNSITLKVTEETERATGAEATISSSINLMSDAIDLKVSSGEIISKINMSLEGIKIAASKIELSGLVKITDLANTGTVVIDAGNIKAGGTIEGVTLKTTGVKITENVIQMYSGVGKMVDSNGNPLLYANSDKALAIGDYDSYLYNLWEYADNIELSSIHSQGGQILLDAYNSHMKLSYNLAELKSSFSTGLTSMGGYNVELTCGNDVKIVKGSTVYSLFSLATPQKLYQDGNTNGYLYINSGGTLLAYNVGTFNIGQQGSPVNYLYTNNFDMVSPYGYFGVFGATPTTKRSCSKASTSGTLNDVIAKLNELIGNFQYYGFC